MKFLVEQIQADRKKAMLVRDTSTKASLDLLLTSIQVLQKKHGYESLLDIPNEQVQEVVVKALKQVNDSIEAYIEVGQNVDKLEAERTLLETYLPKQLNEEEIREHLVPIIKAVKKAGGNYGVVMQQASLHFKGIANMREVGKIAKEMFQK